MKLRATLFFVFATALAGVASLVAPARMAAAEPNGQITILYDAFGTDAAMKKDWGFSALVEIAGKRIIFDTGNDADIFAANVKAKGIDLTKIDFVVLSHRHSDHMAGLNYVLSVNPTVKIYAPKEGFGIYGSSLPSSFELIDKTTEIAPGITLIALVSDAPGTKELKELSLAVNTPDGMVLVVGCAHPGIERIVEAAATINPKIRLIAGGFHLVVAPDDVIAKAVAALKDRFKVEYIAPGHCTGEPTFAALKQAFGNRYLYAGVGTWLPLGPSMGSGERRGEGPALQEDDLTTYRKLANREDPFGLLQARNLRSKVSHL
jgi:7,8-dihydropterin-6-yl-methyl-4-(beta-D-ribofuranosyl)aminobenzene 5'-phosphate synthase